MANNQNSNTVLPSFLIHRVLADIEKETQNDFDWRCTNIFHTRMEHNGRALNVIIDNGSGMNVISEIAVERLGLKAENHPAPYRISWVNESNSTLVKQRCLVQFSLGKHYVDEAWCDVIPMTVCHMLLGRPWLYDRRVSYDGYANSYSFKFKGKKFVLDPLQIFEFEAQPKHKEEVTVPALPIQQFAQTLKGEQLALLVVNREAKQDDGVIPNEFTKMLERFQDILPDELPKHLPPMREVQHTIDLIPGSSLPNLPHYRMSPTENEELNHQIQTLLDNGFIRASPFRVTKKLDITTRRDGYYKFLVQWKKKKKKIAQIQALFGCKFQKSSVYIHTYLLQAPELKRLLSDLFTAYFHQNLPESSSFERPAIDANSEHETQADIQAEIIP